MSATVTANGAGGRARARGQHPPEGAPPRSRAQEIEGFRGIAALSTVIFHVWQMYMQYGPDGPKPPVDGMALGSLISLEVVDLFLVMSAYLLTLSYARAAIDGGTVRPARSFMYRRIIRILPLYYLMVLVVWVSRNPVLPGNWLDLVEHLTFTHLFDRQRIFYTLGPTWSLSLEIIFYFVLVAIGPLAIRFCRRFAKRSTRVAISAGGCVLLYVLPLVWISVARYAYHVGHLDYPVYFGPQARFGGFAAGMLLAVLAVALKDRGTVPTWLAVPLRLASLVALYVLSWVSVPENFAFTFFHPMSSVVWGVLLYATLRSRKKGAWHRALQARWLTFVGLISYSLYILHEPVMLELDKHGLLPGGTYGYPLGTVLVLCLAIPASVVTYWLIEYPAGLLGRLQDKSGAKRDFYPELVN
ncbi:acyltransferase [Streptomyces sp. TS71-3]|uniref:acyltransferase family protein n=1 Tax=Streptomyces sp. TS71-3 TaxID=2733862 RepID=UPI001B29751B|nr:acyltransferase [Streptomyces sp. TS71-3]GHJ42067.1 acyltransferase [Streptomyces sp. TS71-3]